MPMLKSLASFVLALLLAPVALAEDAKITIRWHGQSFFEVVSSAGTRIVIDPHDIPAYGRKKVMADLVLITHFHDDHNQKEPVENYAKAKVLTGLKEEKGESKRIDWNNLDEKFKDVRIRTLGTYHDSMEGMLRGKNGVFIITVDGLNIVHLGDLGHTLSKTQIQRIGQVDVLMIPVGGVYTLNAIDAWKVVEQLKPKRVILPMHYGTPAYDFLLPVKGFLEEQPKKELIKNYKTNEMQLDPKAAAPEEPEIAVLRWEGKGDVPR
jgi:L-ascorbate metabolism protein UlaG (beta-lactamase superfamily)